MGVNRDKCASDGGLTGVSEPVTAVPDMTASGIRRSLEESLERLGLGRVDILYLHDPDDFENEAVSSALPTLLKLRDEGLITAVGAGRTRRRCSTGSSASSTSMSCS
jgi:D-threo-aldose 1-dehydrogenase